MIAWGDMYKVVAAMAPLYFALGLGYGSVRWWRFFTAEQCGAINTLVVNFSMPFFTFDFLARANPYTMNYRVLAADAVSKLLAVAAVSACSAGCFVFRRGGNKATAGAQQSSTASSWAITGFSLAGFNNTLVVGVPLLYAMYGKWAQDLIVQIAVVQSLFWFPLLLLGFELRKAWAAGGGIVPTTTTPQGGGEGVSRSSSSNSDDDDDDDNNSAGRVGRPVSSSSSTSSPPPSQPPPPPKKVADATAAEKDVEMNAEVEEAAAVAAGGGTIRVWPLVRTVALKLAGNPNVYASVVGVVWACIAYRWDLSMPGIVTGSLDVMAKTGTGMSMFSMGLFMAQQEKMIACGAGLATLGMALRFVAGPLATLVGAAAFGLRGDVLCFAIIQAALPQSIASFVFAKEYRLHADVLSTAVIFGTLVSLPVLIAYYAVLGML